MIKINQFINLVDLILIQRVPVPEIFVCKQIMFFSLGVWNGC